ncbi:MAG: hypothetical protein ACOX2Q_02735 [Dehalobacterium sp.]
MELKPQDQDYWHLVEDILSNETFSQLINYNHHHTSIMEHALTVSYFSYVICKKLNLDYVSGARGGLLHDFFLYDWREYKKQPNNKITDSIILRLPWLIHINVLT